MQEASSVPTKSSLSRTKAQLVELMQRVNYGRLEGLAVRRGEPVFNPPPRVLRDFKPCGDNEKRAESDLSDFALKREVIELLDHVAGLDNATIHCVEVREGLPLKWTVEEDAA